MQSTLSNWRRYCINKVFDRLGKAFLQLSFEPLRRLGVDGIGGDDPGWCHRKHRVVIVVAETVDFPSNWRDLAYRRRWRWRLGLSPRCERHQQNQNDTKA